MYHVTLVAWATSRCLFPRCPLTFSSSVGSERRLFVIFRDQGLSRRHANGHVPELMYAPDWHAQQRGVRGSQHIVISYLVNTILD